MGTPMLAASKKTGSMDKVSTPRPTETSMMEVGIWVNSTAKLNSFLLMVLKKLDFGRTVNIFIGTKKI
jgi:hypothetical protein